jgi:hemin uptake protein HemP
MMLSRTHPEPSAGPARPEQSPLAADVSPRGQPLDSTQLLRGQRMIEIAHNGELYRLQATRLGKLILTK